MSRFKLNAFTRPRRLVALLAAAAAAAVLACGSPGGSPAGRPLYRYAGDLIPGAITGQGSDAFGARWDVLTPAGTEVTSSGPLRATEMS
jgi:hypothetical protein